MYPAPQPMSPIFAVFPLTLKLWFVVNVLLPASCGTLVVSRFKVTFPVAPPPVRSTPAVTPLIVPVPTEAHSQELPFHCKT